MTEKDRPLQPVDRRRMLQLLGVGGAVGLAGCADDVDDVEENGFEDDGAGTGGPDDVSAFIEGMGAQASTLDIHGATRVPEAMVLSSIHETLFVMGPDLEPQPHLVEEDWDRNDDATEFTFRIRDGITFHDGNDLNAERVEWTFDRLLDISPQAWRLGPIDTVEATGDMEVTFFYDDPYPLLPQYLANDWLGIVSPEAVEEAGDDYGQEVVVGTGPLEFDEWVRDQEIVLTRNEEYDWAPEFSTLDGPVPYEEFHFANIPEASTLYNELTVGRVHGTTYLGTGDVSEAADHENTQVERIEDPHPNFLPLNVTESPTDEVEVRRAIAHAVNKQAVIDAALNGEGYPIWNVCPPLAEGGLDEETARELGYEYDREAARAELEAAGWTNDAEGEVRSRDGEDLEVDLFAFSITRYSRVGEVIESMLTNVGFDVNFEILEAGTLYDRAEGSEHNILTMSLSGGYLAVDTLESALLSDNVAPEGGTNYSLYESDEFDDAVAQAKSAPDESDRADAVREAQEIVLEECPVVPVTGYTKNYAYENDVDVGELFDHPWWPDQYMLHRLEVDI